MEGLTLTFPVSGSAPKQTCKQCRLRKVRCHGGRRGESSCNNCERLRFTCSFDADQANGTHSSSKNGGGSGDIQDDDRPEPRRVSKACLRCREHKIRCSGGDPCSACRGKELSCEYSASARKRPKRAHSPTTTPTRKRERSSVGNARNESERDQGHRGTNGDVDMVASSVKSSGHSSGLSVPTITQDETPQISSQNQEPIPSLEPPTITSHDADESRSPGVIPSVAITHLVYYFFDSVYPLPSYSFFHPTTTLKRFRQGRLEPCVVYALAAFASVRSPPSQRCQDLETVWAEKVETFIWQHLESPSLARLQAMLLIILFRAETGHLRRAFMMAALAGRAAAAMRLNHERPGGNKASLEVRRRIMWSLKLVERYFSVGLPEFELCPVDNLYIQLPCRERDFAGEDREVVASLSDDLGAYHICVELEMLRRDLMKLQRSLALCVDPYPQLSKLMRDFQAQLDRIGAQLPGGRELSSDALKELLNDRWLPRHLLMRLSWHECYYDLYRLLLRGFREAAPRVVIDSMDSQTLDTAEEVCIHHCKAIVHIIGTINNESQQARLLEFDTAICAYNASRLLLFIARFGYTASRPSDEFALSRAELCSAALRRFFPESKLVQPILKEVRRLINEFLSKGTPTPSRLASPRMGNQDMSQDPLRRLSHAAKTRQRLAVHSLLRQAGFSDEEDEPDDGPEPAETSPALQAQMVSPGILDSVSSQANHLSAEASGFVPTGPTLGSADFPLDQTTPDTQVDSESWRHDFFAGGDLLHGGEFDNYTETGSTLHHRSFIFPWLQRDQTD